jgi:hypothetical protein
VKPGATVTYMPDSATSGNVTATLTADKTILLPAGRSGNATGTVFTKVYTANENASFLITDPVGNTGEATVIITRIDKTVPQVLTTTYSPTTQTSGPVMVKLTFDEPVTLTGRIRVDATTYTKIYTSNIQETISFFDLAGNANSMVITISQIVSPTPPQQSQPSSGGGGAGKVILVKDDCPNGDYTHSYYDHTCGSRQEEKGEEHNAAENQKNSEYLTAYQWAYKN